jgi:hypothetical protein
MSWTTKTGTTPRTVKLRDGHEVTVAYRDPADHKVLWIERLLNLAGEYGTVTVHGTLYKPTAAELISQLMFVFDVSEVRVLKTVTVHGSVVTSVQNDIESRTRRGWGSTVEWPKDWGRSHREAEVAFKGRIPVPSNQTCPTILARGTRYDPPSDVGLLQRIPARPPRS